MKTLFVIDEVLFPSFFGNFGIRLIRRAIHNFLLPFGIEIQVGRIKVQKNRV